MPPTLRKRYQKRRTLRTFLKAMRGGGEDKYVLLSCPEFDSLVDTIISNDGPITMNGVPIEGDISQINSDVSTLTAENKHYMAYLKEAGLDPYDKDDNLVPSVIDNPKNKQHYMRKHNSFETKHFYRGYINWNSFADKSPDIRMNADTTIRLRGAKVIYFAYFSFNEPEVTTIIDQFLYLNSLTHYGINELNIVLPYFPVGTAERIVGEGETPAAGPMAHMINSIPEAGAKNNIYIFDIHALCSRFFFHSNTRPVLMSIMPEYLAYINHAYPEGPGTPNYNIIVFPDDGAKKRFDTLLPPKTKKIICSKVRKGKERIIKIDSGMEYLTQGISEGKQLNMFLIDDLVQTGGSVLEAYNGIHKIINTVPDFKPEQVKYIPIITHSVFPISAKLDAFFAPGKPGNATIAQLVTTNTRPTMAKALVEKYGPDRVVVLDISHAISTVFTNHMDKTYITPYIIN